jgi:hypothetical protein
VEAVTVSPAELVERQINPVSGLWEEVVRDDGRYALVLRHSNGRERTMDRLGNEFIAHQLASRTRRDGFPVRVIDRTKEPWR